MSLKKQLTIMWFRQDLRLKDNPALHAACEAGQVLPIFIDDDTAPRPIGGASRWWLHHSLNALNKSLNQQLRVFKGSPLAILKALIAETGAQSVVWNRCYEPWQIARDKEIKAALKAQGVAVNSYQANLLWEPWTLLNKTGTPYKVFTPYYRKGCLQAPAPREVLPAPSFDDRLYVEATAEALNIGDLALIPDIPWYNEMAQQWVPGEEGAADNLSRFLSRPVERYDTARDKPSVKGTSRLSPHLHFGEISPNQVWYAVFSQVEGTLDNNRDRYLSEIGWREFSYYLLYHFPELPQKNFNPRFDAYPWKGENSDLAAWQKGQTGVPIIDAGMRELWQTGYMHNRVRMIVGSYLVKNLGIHWHHGEAWFWDCLLDADMAANAASWQWVAGSGADAAPFFRIFNPVLQGEKFDKQGAYVRRYCPELKDLADKYIHSPWLAPSEELERAGVTLGKTYPKPLVDLKASRQSALDGYEAVKNSG
ncbi:MAG: cryptochrome/photolyase family protein [Pontibacterium sp.]